MNEPLMGLTFCFCPLSGFFHQAGQTPGRDPWALHLHIQPPGCLGFDVSPKTLLRPAFPYHRTWQSLLQGPLTWVPLVPQVPSSPPIFPLTHPSPPSIADVRVMFARVFRETLPCIKTFNLRNCLWDRCQVLPQSPSQPKHSPFQASFESTSLNTA